MDGAVAAHYEYDPYGNTIAKSGALADVNPFRFSTKYFDSETSFYYYGHRYYSTGLGRWISRDPLGEEVFLRGYVEASGSRTTRSCG
jgi:RHS repeat-associated protein